MDNELLWLSTVKDDNCASKVIDDHLIDSCTLSQDSFSDLFASSTASTPGGMPQSNIENSEVFSSLNMSTLKDNNDSILDFFDGNDSKLVELDVSGLISSYNSACKELENQKKDSTLVDESRKTSQQESADIENVNTNMYNQLERSSTNDNFVNGTKNECQGGDESEKLFYGLPLNVESLIKKHKGINNLYGKL